ncbi:unnamed protein product [Trichogramma brassicae]|uniref:Uncharacterized protein n=1 Tax=Trichogramma brassicae TaxID=86971 RepID=A0A6H5IV41_9HYME|nr:unnamed protein product [Trichogramma brassicae]
MFVYPQSRRDSRHSRKSKSSSRRNDDDDDKNSSRRSSKHRAKQPTTSSSTTRYSGDERQHQQSQRPPKPPRKSRSKSKRRSRRKKSSDQFDAAATENDEEEEDEEQQLRYASIRIHRSDMLEADYLTRRPMVKVHLVYAETGEYPRSRGAKPSDEQQSLLPISTDRFDFRAKRSMVPVWEQELVFEFNYRHLLAQGRAAVVLLFEIIDRVSGGGGGGGGGDDDGGSFDRNDTRDPYWYKVAWAFLRPVGVNGAQHVDKRVRLQLYRPKKAFWRCSTITTRRNNNNNKNNNSKTPTRCDIYKWWKSSSSSRVKYPSSLYVTVCGVEPSTPRLLESVRMTTRHRDEQPLKIDDLTDLNNDEDDNNKSGCRPTTLLDEESSRMTTMDGLGRPKWTRHAAQSCQIPNDLAWETGEASERGCFALAFSHDGKYLACACSEEYDYPILVYKLDDGKVSVRFAGHKNFVYSVNWSGDDRQLVTCSSDQTARIWDVAEKIIEPLQALPHPSYVYCSQFLGSNGGSSIVTGCYDHVARVWSRSANDFELIQELEGHESFVSAVCCDEAADQLITGDGAGTLIVWLLQAKKTSTPTTSSSSNRHRHRHRVRKEWQIARKLKLKDLEGVTINTLLGLGRSANGRLIVHSRNDELRLLEPATGLVVRKFTAPPQLHRNRRIQARACASPCGGLLFCGGDEASRLCVWSLDTGRLLATYELTNNQNQAVTCVDYHPYDHALAYSCYGAPGQPVRVLRYDREADGGRVGLKLLQVQSQPQQHMMSVNPMARIKLEPMSRNGSATRSLTTATSQNGNLLARFGRVDDSAEDDESRSRQQQQLKGRVQNFMETGPSLRAKSLSRLSGIIEKIDRILMYATSHHHHQQKSSGTVMVDVEAARREEDHLPDAAAAAAKVFTVTQRNASPVEIIELKDLPAQPSKKPRKRSKSARNACSPTTPDNSAKSFFSDGNHRGNNHRRRYSGGRGSDDSASNRPGQFVFETVDLDKIEDDDNYNYEPEQQQQQRKDSLDTIVDGREEDFPSEEVLDVESLKSDDTYVVNKDDDDDDGVTPAVNNNINNNNNEDGSDRSNATFVIESEIAAAPIFLWLAIITAEARNCGDPYHKIDQVIERVPKPPPQNPKKNNWSGDPSLEDDGGNAANEVNDKPAPLTPQRPGQRTSGGKNSAPAEDYVMKGDPHALDEINKQMDEMRKPLDYDDDDDVDEVARPEAVVQKEPQQPPQKQQQEWQPQKQQQEKPPQQQSQKEQQQQQPYVIGIPIILPMFNMQFPPPGSKQQQTAIIKVVYMNLFCSATKHRPWVKFEVRRAVLMPLLFFFQQPRGLPYIAIIASRDLREREKKRRRERRELSDRLDLCDSMPICVSSRTHIQQHTLPVSRRLLPVPSSPFRHSPTSSPEIRVTVPSTTVNTITLTTIVRQILPSSNTTPRTASNFHRPATELHSSQKAATTTVTKDTNQPQSHMWNMDHLNTNPPQSSTTSPLQLQSSTTSQLQSTTSQPQHQSTHTCQSRLQLQPQLQSTHTCQLQLQLQSMCHTKSMDHQRPSQAAQLQFQATQPHRFRPKTTCHSNRLPTTQLQFQATQPHRLHPKATCHNTRLQLKLPQFKSHLKTTCHNNLPHNHKKYTCQQPQLQSKSQPLSTYSSQLQSPQATKSVDPPRPHPSTTSNTLLNTTNKPRTPTRIYNSLGARTDGGSVDRYATDWYKWTAKNRLYLLMIMIRAVKPFGGIAGPGIPVDLSTVTFALFAVSAFADILPGDPRYGTAYHREHHHAHHEQEVGYPVHETPKGSFELPSTSYGTPFKPEGSNNHHYEVQKVAPVPHEVYGPPKQFVPAPAPVPVPAPAPAPAPIHYEPAPAPAPAPVHYEPAPAPVHTYVPVQTPAPAPVHYEPVQAPAPAPAPAPVQQYVPVPAPAPVQQYVPVPAPAPVQQYVPVQTQAPTHVPHQVYGPPKALPAPVPSHPAPQHPAPHHPAPVPSHPAPHHPAPVPSYPAPQHPAPQHPAPVFPTKPLPSFQLPSLQLPSFQLPSQQLGEIANHFTSKLNNNQFSQKLNNNHFSQKLNQKLGGLMNALPMLPQIRFPSFMKQAPVQQYLPGPAPQAHPQPAPQAHPQPAPQPPKVYVPLPAPAPAPAPVQKPTIVYVPAPTPAPVQQKPTIVYVQAPTPAPVQQKPTVVYVQQPAPVAPSHQITGSSQTTSEHHEHHVVEHHQQTTNQQATDSNGGYLY